MTSAKDIRYFIWTFYALKYQPINRVRFLKEKEAKCFTPTESFCLRIHADLPRTNCPENCTNFSAVKYLIMTQDFFFCWKFNWRTVKRRQLILQFTAVTRQKQNRSCHKTKSKACEILRPVTALDRLKLGSQWLGTSLIYLFIAVAWQKKRKDSRCTLPFLPVLCSDCNPTF